MSRYLLIFAIMFLALFTACGGSGSSTSADHPSNPVSTIGAAQGVYSGTTSNGSSFEAIVLPNDKFYAIYGTTTGGTLLVYGMMVGQGNSSSSAFTASFTDFYWSGPTYLGSINANFVAGTSFSGSFTENGTTSTFNATGSPSSTFNFNTPAQVTAVTGSWSGYFLDGSSSTVTVSSTGSFSGAVQGCSFTGTITPDSAKNFYNVTVAFGASPCLLPNQSANGIAINTLLADGIHHQLLVGVNSAQFGTLFIGER
jgi:hypothetical protein